MKNNRRLSLFLVLVLVLAIALAGCGKQAVNEKTLTIGATSKPHAEILNHIVPLLQEKGIELKVIEFADYAQLNPALKNKELDANFFQHSPYLNDYNSKEKATLISAVAVHFEPLGLYPGKTKALDQIKDGDIIAVPNDTTNEARALLLLESMGLIKIKEGAGFNATVRDIVENPKNLKIEELDAAQLARALPDVNLAVINGNYAIQAGLNVAKDALIAEDKDSVAAQSYANIVVVRAGDENREAVKILKEVITSEEVKKFINDKYEGSVIPVF